MAFWGSGRLLEEMDRIKQAIADLKIEREAAGKEVGLTRELVALKTEISDLKIDKGRITEEHAKRERELTHMIGLEKKRQEVELDQARRDIALKVREENLAADKSRFTEEMKFQRERFEKEVGYLKDMMADILDRLPNVNVALGLGKK